MFSSISWSQYFTFIGIALIFYYAFIGVKYFNWELLSFAGIQKEEGGPLNKITIPRFSQQNASEDEEDSGPDVTPVIQAFHDEIAAYAEEARINNPSREEVINSIRLIAVKYPVLAEDGNTSTRDEIILVQINNHLSISLSRQDLGTLK